MSTPSTRIRDAERFAAQRALQVHLDAGRLRVVGFAADAGRSSVDGGHAVVSGRLGFATCFHETGYTSSTTECGSLRPGQTASEPLDVRTLRGLADRRLR